MWCIYDQPMCHCYPAHELYSVLMNSALCTVFVRHSLYVIPYAAALVTGLSNRTTTSYNRSTNVKQRKRQAGRSTGGSHRSQHGGNIRSLVANHITEFKRFTYRPIREWRK